MSLLDFKTIERLAVRICDLDGPYERRGWQLEELLRRAGWVPTPEYDGSARVPWLRAAMEDRTDRPGDLDRLVCRVCDPLEYDDGMGSAAVFCEVVNSVLESERLLVSYVSGRPVLGELGETGREAVYSKPTDLEHRLPRLVQDDKTVELLLARLSETTICEDHGAYTMAVIGVGSFVEGLLLAILTERDADFRVNGLPGSKGGRIKPDRVPLAMLIDVVHAKGWIQVDAKDFMHQVREYRNFIHPRAQLAKEAEFDQDSVMLCWAPVRALVNDLEARLSLVEQQ